MRFCVAGGVNTLADFGIFMVLHYKAGVKILPAHTVAFALAVACSFLLNRFWVFAGQGREAGGRGQFARFLGVTLASLALSAAVVGGLSHFLPAWAAKVAAIAVTMATNYTGYSRFVFRR